MKTVRNHINDCTDNIAKLCAGIADLVNVIRLGDEDLTKKALQNILESNFAISGNAWWIRDCIKELSLDDEL